jgi:hypothetical protein
VEGARAELAHAARPDPLSMLVRVGRQEGAAALFRGVGVVVAAAAPGQALYFSGYEAAKALAPKDSGLSSFGSGVAAQLCGALAWVPMVSYALRCYTILYYVMLCYVIRRYVARLNIFCNCHRAATVCR